MKIKKIKEYSDEIRVVFEELPDRTIVVDKEKILTEDDFMLQLKEKIKDIKVPENKKMLNLDKFIGEKI